VGTDEIVTSIVIGTEIERGQEIVMVLQELVGIVIEAERETVM
jgi:hypothetical protein